MARLGVAGVVVAVLSAEATAQSWPNLPAPPHPIADPWAEPEPAAATPAPPTDAPSPASEAAPATQASLMKMRADPPPTQRSRELVEATQLPTELLPAPPRYPRSHVARPLVLPAGMREVWVSAAAGHESMGVLAIDYGMVGAGARFGARSVEVYVGANFVPVHRADMEVEDFDIPMFQRAYAGLKMRTSDDTAVGATAVIGNIGSDHVRYSPSVFAAHKFRPSERGAITISGGIDYNIQKEVYDLVSHRVGAFGRLAGQMQVTDEVAVELSASAAYYAFVDDLARNQDTFYTHSYGAGLMLAVTDHADLEPYVSIGDFEGGSSFAAGLGLSVR